MFSLESARRKQQRGVILLLGTLSIPVLVSMMGLGIDASVLYATRSSLQLAADGAALAAARALSIGLTTAEQQTAAQTNATNWFNKNFPSGSFGSSSTTLDTPQVFDDPVQANVRHVVLTAHTSATTYFMRFWGYSTFSINITSDAARRDAVVMMVLDRSGSMNTGGATDACTLMKAAAKTFTGLFSQGRDRIGLAVFNTGVTMASAPDVNFKTTLGYTDSSGSANGLIDNIGCGGGTGTPHAISVGYNELYRAALPGALNVVLLFTDGEPNVIVPDYRGGVTARQGALKLTSGCTDSVPTSISAGGNIQTKPPSWSSATTWGSGSFLANIPAGPIIGSYSDSSQDLWGYAYSSSSLSNSPSRISLSGCGSNPYSSDVDFIPDTDAFGVSIDNTSFYPLNRATYLSANRISGTNYNGHFGAYNTAFNAANVARVTRNLPSGTSFPGVFVNAIGLGTVNHSFMQHVANDPNADPGGGYPAYAGYDPNTPVGTYVWAQNSTELNASFAAMASFILRLAK